jgi:hypothetical protein
MKIILGLLALHSLFNLLNGLHLIFLRPLISAEKSKTFPCPQANKVFLCFQFLPKMGLGQFPTNFQKKTKRKALLLKRISQFLA